jgi:hypothetical protein
MIFIALFLAASFGPGHAQDRFFGFTIKGQVINPLCLEHIHPWSSDGVIIVKSLVLEYCQDSNWAFADNPIEVEGDVVSTKLKNGVDSEVSSSIFSYRIVGKTDNGLFIALLPENEVAAYTIAEQTIKSDLFAPDPDRVHVLTQVALSSVACLQTIRVEGNTVIVTKNVLDEHAPRSDQCTPKIETVSYHVSPEDASKR